MYHFPNRDALMVALVEHEAIQLRRRMTNLLSTSLAMATVADRYRAYIQAAAEGENMRGMGALVPVRVLARTASGLDPPT
jgi:AcrR family transcriptional regulator